MRITERKVKRKNSEGVIRTLSLLHPPFRTTLMQQSECPGQDTLCLVSILVLPGLVPRPLRAIRVTRRGLGLRQVASHPKSPRTTGNKAGRTRHDNQSPERCQPKLKLLQLSFHCVYSFQFQDTTN